jgi:uncharacterized protein YqeY
MRSRMRQDLTAALKARDQTAVAALKSALAAIDNAEAVADERSHARGSGSEHIAGATAGAGSSDVPRRTLSEADLQAIVRAQLEERHEAADLYERLGREDEAARLRREAAVLTQYLPDLSDPA